MNVSLMCQDDELGQGGYNNLGNRIPFVWGVHALGCGFEIEPHCGQHAKTIPGFC